jgi:glycosyltransferase involved in cell wall biosynthesis
MHIAVVIPVFNDWRSLSKLIGKLELVDLPPRSSLSLFVVDDGSTEPAEIDYPLHTLSRIKGIEIITLTCNLGHQRAIAVGLVETGSCKDIDLVLVMDCDGEDRPEDIPQLLSEAVRLPGHIVCAQRTHRPTSMAFRFWYQCYKLTFRLLTGSKIDFGNFCLIPHDKIPVVVSYASIWNNLAATLTRVHIPLNRVPITRGRRYAGESKMNFVSLFAHGMGAMAVFAEIMMIRLMLGALVLSAVTTLGILAVVAVRMFTDLAIPGWASAVAGLLMIILFQGLTVFTISAVTILNSRGIKGILPRVDANDFVLFRRKILPMTAAVTTKVVE